LNVGEVIGAEYSDVSDVYCSAASSAPSASSDIFTRDDIKNYVGQREEFVDKYRPQNETHSPRVFKMFFYDELVELIVHETNTYAAQKIQARSFIPLRSRMRDCTPVTTDEMYVVLAFFMLIGIIQKPTLRLYFSKETSSFNPIFWKERR
jgi:hypothetical protein